MTLDSGSSVSVSSNGSILAVGGSADNGGVGATWIFVYNGTTYNQLGSKLLATDSSGTSQQGKGGPSRCVVYHMLYDRDNMIFCSGFSVRLSSDGGILVVGGYASKYQAGTAWIFVYDGSTYRQLGKELVGTGSMASTTIGKQGRKAPSHGT